MRSTLGLALLTITSALLVPPPSGPYDVAMRIQSVTDSSRPADPLDLRDRGYGRRIMFSVFLPVDKRGQNGCSCPLLSVPYMTPRVAADYGRQAAEFGVSAGFFSAFTMQVCHLDGVAACRTDRQFPVVLFTPGLSESRLLYGAGARSLASHGYAVVTVDHPFEANFVEFPDGAVLVGRNIPGDDEPVKENAIRVRAADLSFVIDQLHNNTLRRSLLDRYPGSLDLGRIVVYAHSVGGGAAAMLTRDDRRVLGGVDFDGQIVEPIRSQGLSKPFLLAGRYGHSAPNSTDPTWNQFWPHLTGPRVELAINGTTHGSYTDRPLLISALGLPDVVLDQFAGEIGSIKGPNLQRMVDSVLMAFFDFVFYGKAKELDRLTQRYSEVSITRRNLGPRHGTHRRIAK
ncbi:PAF acetylhydrolase family protein [Metarhizium rileyi]|uniref:1-alkyl-2-acetylglycerophosphocholine esterase n=1 Tax=Metarhizium rileyi (strain RCEF 4871) TaxID=1649241 RepID=A0A166YED8_METRR|nr:PAF acetylhydrolase family protein [Metarhizium rileyi RCEF 4871]